MSKLCPTCGMLSEDSSNICSHCGTALPELVQNDNVVEAITTPIEEIETLDLADNNVQEVPTPVQGVVEELPVAEVTPVVETVSNTLPKTVTPIVEEVQPQEVINENIPVQPEELPTPVQGVVEELPVAEVTPVVETVSNPLPETVTPTVEEVQPQEVINETVSVQSMETTATPEVNNKPVLDANTVIDVPEGIEEVSAENIVNNDLESVSVQVVEETVPVEEPIPEIVLPEATVSEIDPSLLTNMYEEAEKKNEDNKAILAKQEEERLAREEAERLEKLKQEPKPDLMARTDLDEDGLPINRKKKKSFLPKFFIILIIMLLGAGLYWFFFVKQESVKEDTYETPIEEYYAALNKKDKDALLKTYVPCTREDENVNNEIAVSLAALNIYESIKIEYKITSTEVVNSVDQDSIKTTMLGTYCGLENIPEITNYKHIFVEQTLITDERTTTNVEFWVVQIEDKWYIVPVTENI